ncbi:hypothetical protein PQX77_019738 [Marasmius sp. AFHP31]|nr:hypothetical protein PQX77_019738 [Marasmius sp. AFHP31]
MVNSDFTSNPRTPGRGPPGTINSPVQQTEFARQAPPHMQEEGEEVNEPVEETQVEQEEDLFGLEELRALPRAIPLYRVNTDSLVSGLDLKPSLQGLYKFGKNKVLWERRETALRLAASYFQRPGLQHLTPAKRAAMRSFEFAGQQLPIVPTWPREGGSAGQDYLLENDFEILAILYRAMAEDFLARIHVNHSAQENLSALPYGITVKNINLTYQPLMSRQVREMWTDSEDEKEDYGSERENSRKRNPGYPGDNPSDDDSDNGGDHG